jgi:hypothetical protein
MNLNNSIVNVFCETDDFMENFCKSTTLRKRGPAPKLADSEVLTMEIVGEILGLNTDKQIFRFFKRFYSYYFPGLSSRVTFVRQADLLRFSGAFENQLAGDGAGVLAGRG